MEAAGGTHLDLELLQTVQVGLSMHTMHVQGSPCFVREVPHRLCRFCEHPEHRKPVNPDFQISRNSDFRISGFPEVNFSESADVRNSGFSDFRTSDS